MRDLRQAAPTMSAVELVEAALDDESVFKVVISEFERRGDAAPDLAAAERVARAYDAGRVPAWLAAVLLGRVGHPAGCPALLAIVRAGDEMARGYVVEAFGRLAGEGPVDELVALLRDGDSQRARSMAARSLAAVGARSAIPEVAASVRAGRIGFWAAREALVGLGVEDERVAAWLRSDARVDATLGCAVVFERLERQRAEKGSEGPSAALGALVLTAIDAGTPSLLRHEEAALRSWAARVSGAT
ncbi:MAG: HEAT repeat domain-containing protein [Deltaproteobacteria bacterium]|nr:HEAT repeat domain-containing protein [Myxococcales bacterium]MDP3220590.1 HEAT repeat domain-containing protein [Deltaproteobacteria bacterium]